MYGSAVNERNAVVVKTQLGTKKKRRKNNKKTASTKRQVAEANWGESCDGGSARTAKQKRRSEGANEGSRWTDVEAG